MLIWRVCAAVQTCCRLALWILKEAEVGYQVSARRHLAAWQDCGNLIRPIVSSRIKDIAISSILESRQRKLIGVKGLRDSFNTAFASMLAHAGGEGDCYRYRLCIGIKYSTSSPAPARNHNLSQ